jgi:protein-tyrosine phosphatase
MIDVHHHLIYGLDDGPRDFVTSCEMIDAAIANGITHIVATPHSNDRWVYMPDVNAERLAEIEAYAAGRVTLGIGCDFHLSYDNIQDQFKNPTKYSINHLSYLLVEFPDFGIPANIGETLHEFVASGVVPILTHPERNATLQAKPETMAEWIRYGCIVQVTAGSLLGRFGSKAQAAAELLLQRDWVTLLASDAHNLSSRPPNLGDGHKALLKSYGQEVADRLCIHNPRAIFYGEPLPSQPEPQGLTEEAEAKGKGLLSRIFSR